MVQYSTWYSTIQGTVWYSTVQYKANLYFILLFNLLFILSYYLFTVLFILLYYLFIILCCYLLFILFAFHRSPHILSGSVRL